MNFHQSTPAICLLTMLAISSIVQNDVIGETAAPKIISANAQSPSSKATAAQNPTTALIKHGKRLATVTTGKGWSQKDGFLQGTGKAGSPITNKGIASGDFQITARLRILNQKASAASFFLDDNHFGFEGNRETLFVNGPIFGGLKLLGRADAAFKRNDWFNFHVIRKNGKLSFLINNKLIHSITDSNKTYSQFGFNPWRSTIHISDLAIEGKLIAPAKPLPFTDVFVSGEGYPSFRIPAVVVSQKGTVLAFAEGRARHNDHASNNIVLKRSTNAGSTWKKLILIAEDGDNSLNNPQAVVVPKSGRIILMYQRYPHNVHEARVVAGLKGDKICRNFITSSDDDGLTWSKSRDITAQVKRPTTATSIAGGPGVGIVLTQGKRKGRIIMPFNQGPRGDWKVYAVFSDDGGDTWQFGSTAPNGNQKTPEGKGVGNEVQMAELSDGTLMLNTRVQGGNRHRKIAYSKDAGNTWSQLKNDPTLIEPQCQASILRYSGSVNDNKGSLLFVNPASTTQRSKGTVRISYDDGITWPISKLVYPGPFAYSCLTVLKEGTVGILFERDGYKAISFMRVTLKQITDGHSVPK